MVNFSKSKIYKIYNSELTYIDSTTCKYLSDVLSKWKHKYNKYKKSPEENKRLKVFDVFECGEKTTKIALIQEYPCENRHQLDMRKNEVIQEHDCINKEEVIKQSEYSRNDYKYECIYCNYRCYYKGDFNKHVKSRKHEKNKIAYLEGKNHAENEKLLEKSSEVPNQKHIKERNGKINANNIDEFREMLKMVNLEFNQTSKVQMQNHNELLNQQNELKKELLEIKNISSKQSNTVNSVNIYQNNFNVMNYLNNECNDAPNIYQFINSLPINIDNCKKVAQDGFLEDFQKTFVQALNDCEQNMRPIHCTDVKRNTCYIKNADNLWIRDSKEHNELYNVFDYLQNKHLLVFKKHKEREPNWMDDDENLDFFNTFITNINEMHRKRSGEGPKLFKKLINATLKNNKLVKL